VTDVAPLNRIEAFVFRYPIATPVKTSFGVMHDRPAVFVRAQDRDGVVGWGEAWCNFPAVGAEHRARLINELLAPLAIGESLSSPRDLFEALTARTAVLAIQSGEPGPLAQAIAGVDIALWDIAAKRAGEPLWRFLGGGARTIAVYASGVNPDAPERVVRAMQAKGHCAFKLKVGFGDDLDRRNLAAIRDAIGDGPLLMADANQGWDVEYARAVAPTLEPFRLGWLEEPIRADRPWSEWRALAAATAIPLAAGENIAGLDGFAAALDQRILGVVQPDAAKWGGVSGCLAAARMIRESGARYCPHFLGGGVGLLASAHLLAAVGGDGMLEIDVNENPLRDRLCGPVADVRNGRVTLGEEPGLGIEPDLDALAQFRRDAPLSP
jgi:L-alanine-DL-glutamate epimerase-like enolase superfamily enzyme